MGTVSKGTSLELDGTTSGVWVHVKVSGIGIGYMHQDYVGKGTASTGSSAVKTAQTALNSKFKAGLTVDGIWDLRVRKHILKQSRLHLIPYTALALQPMASGEQTHPMPVLLMCFQKGPITFMSEFCRLVFMLMVLPE